MHELKCKFPKSTSRLSSSVFKSPICEYKMTNKITSISILKPLDKILLTSDELANLHREQNKNNRTNFELEAFQNIFLGDNIRRVGKCSFGEVFSFFIRETSNKFF